MADNDRAHPTTPPARPGAARPNLLGPAPSARPASAAAAGFDEDSQLRMLSALEDGERRPGARGGSRRGASGSSRQLLVLGGGAAVVLIGAAAIYLAQPFDSGHGDATVAHAAAVQGGATHAAPGASAAHGTGNDGGGAGLEGTPVTAVPATVPALAPTAAGASAAAITAAAPAASSAVVVALATPAAATHPADGSAAGATPSATPPATTPRHDPPAKLAAPAEEVIEPAAPATHAGHGKHKDKSGAAVASASPKAPATSSKAATAHNAHVHAATGTAVASSSHAAAATPRAAAASSARKGRRDDGDADADLVAAIMARLDRRGANPPGVSASAPAAGSGPSHGAR